MKKIVICLSVVAISIMLSCSAQIKFSHEQLKKELGYIEGTRYINTKLGISYLLPPGVTFMDWPVQKNDVRVEGNYFRSHMPDWYDYYISIGMTAPDSDTVNIKVQRATDRHLRQRTRNMILADSDAMIMIRTPMAYMLKTLGVRGEPVIPYKIQIINGVKFHTMAIQFSATDNVTKKKKYLAVYSFAAVRGRYWLVIDEYKTMKDFFKSEKALIDNKNLHTYRILQTMKLK